MRRRALTESLPSVSDSASRFVPCAIYSHVSTYRASQLELQLYSPSLKVDARGPLAVFNDHDQVEGKLVLDCSAHHTGKLTLSIEGSFVYPSQSSPPPYSESRRHVFLHTSHTIAVTPSPGTSPRFTFRDAFMRRRPSASFLTAKSGIERTYPFQLPLPQGSRPGEELPPSFSIDGSMDGSPLVTTSEISYKVIASWEPEGSDAPPSYLEVPIVLQPDGDFQSPGVWNSMSGDAWLEMPLKTERPIPIQCAVALPTSVTFCRSSSIPYFVVFATTPRSPLLAREIAADSTICVSLIRQITIHEPQTTFPLTPPATPSGDDAEFPRSRILRRVAKSSPRLNRKRKSRGSFVDEDAFRDKPLPGLPLRACFSETKTIWCDICIGFPKRPRHKCESGSHPSLEAQSSLPDGLHKSRIHLDKDMLPCIDWAGVSVKYYLDISVLIGQDDLRARIPVRIF